jgi:hypothetical protein
MSSRKRRSSSRLQKDSKADEKEQNQVEDMLAEAPHSECATGLLMQFMTTSTAGAATTSKQLLCRML